MKCSTPVKIMHSRFYLLMALILLQPLSIKAAFAKDVLFVPRMTLSVAQYEFTKPTTVNGLGPGKDFPEVNFDFTFKFLGLGGTLFKNSYYLDMFYQESTNESTSFTVEDPVIPGGKLSANFDGRRRDFALTIGKKILDGRGGIYAGYKEGKTGGPQSQGQHLSFKEDGFFLGGNYGWLVSDLGVISLNFAYAKMDGNRIQKTNTGFEEAEPPFIINLNGNGDTDGFSYGATWSSRLTDHISYSLGLEVRQYSFDNIKDVNPEVAFSDEIEETFSGITFSTYYSF